jgi:peptidoglycan/LPS O-acetylase OafA/YrhL
VGQPCRRPRGGRAARLLPALLLVLIITDTWFAVSGRGAPIKESLSVLFYAKNYRDVVVGSPGVFGQAWSLAIEEHFYLLWPALLLAMIARWGRRKVVLATLGIALAAVLWRLSIVALTGTGRWPYVDTFGRADGLLIGCAAAIAVRHELRVPPHVTAGAVAVFAWCASPMWHPQAVEQTVGYTVQATACALIVAGMDSADSRLRRALSSRPVVTTGLLSYGVYLWHIPVLAVMPSYPPWIHNLAVVALSFALAAASYWGVERPLRRWATSAFRSRRGSALPTAKTGQALAAPRRILHVWHGPGVSPQLPSQRPC